MISRLSEGSVTWALGLRGLAEEVCRRSGALGSSTLQALFATATPRVGPLCFVAETLPFLARKTHSTGVQLEQLSFFHYCSREFCRTGVRCEVAGLGVGSGSVVESGTVSFARRYLASKGHHRWRSGEESACRCRRRIAFLSWEDPLEEEMAAHSSNLVWRTPWTEEPGGLQSIGLQRVRRGDTHTHTHTT